MLNSNRLFLWVAGLSWIGAARPTAAGENPLFTLPMHAAYGAYSDCSGYLPVDCLSNRPTVNIAGNVDASIFLCVANYQSLNAIQVGIKWDAAWWWVYGWHDCQAGQRGAIQRDSPTTASGVTVFDCVNGPALAVIDRILFQVPGSGCVQFIQPKDPLGICIQDCRGEIDQITGEYSARLGKVCVNSGGFDACDPVVPVEPVTWGKIKASFGLVK
jgi:hypothetical protein